MLYIGRSHIFVSKIGIRKIILKISVIYVQPGYVNYMLGLNRSLRKLDVFTVDNHQQPVRQRVVTVMSIFRRERRVPPRRKSAGVDGGSLALPDSNTTTNHLGIWTNTRTCREQTSLSTDSSTYSRVTRVPFFCSRHLEKWRRLLAQHIRLGHSVWEKLVLVLCL